MNRAPCSVNNGEKILKFIEQMHEIAKRNSNKMSLEICCKPQAFTVICYWNVIFNLQEHSAMPAYCVVAACQSKAVAGRTWKESIFLHRFPKDVSLTASWTRFVRLSRADFTASTEHSHVCSNHFKEEDYENILEFNMKRSLGQTCK